MTAQKISALTQSTAFSAPAALGRNRGFSAISPACSARSGRNFSKISRCPRRSAGTCSRAGSFPGVSGTCPQMAIVWGAGTYRGE